MTLPSETRLIRLPEVRHWTGRSRAAIYQAMREGTFPKSIAIGPRTRAWRTDEIQSWIEARTAERNTAEAVR